MGLRINTNVNALTALTNLRRTDSTLATSLQRLSTGLRINKASDDPAGLVISEQFRAQIVSTNQAIENTQFNSNLIGTTEAALQEISDLLIGIRESAIFAKNTGGISDEQVQAEQDAVDSAISAIDRIASTTRFGRRNLLDGSAGFVTSTGGNGLDNLNVQSVFLGGTSQAFFTAQVTGLASQATRALPAGIVASNTGGNVTIRVTGALGSEDLSFFSTVSQAQLSAAINATRDFTGVYASGGAAFSETFGADVAIQIDVTSGTAAAGVEGRDEGVDATVVVAGAQVQVDGLEVRIQSSFIKAQFTVAASSYSQTFAVKDFSGLVFQLGSEPKASDQVRIGIQSVDSGQLGFEEITLPGPGGDPIGGFLSSLTAGGDNDLASNPDNAIRILDKALDQVNGLRGYLGALQADTLEPNERSLSVAVENLTASESSIRDLDFAAETSNFTRAQILFNAGTAVLASANLIPQQVLSLLGG